MAVAEVYTAEWVVGLIADGHPTAATVGLLRCGVHVNVDLLREVGLGGEVDVGATVVADVAQLLEVFGAGDDVGIILGAVAIKLHDGIVGVEHLGIAVGDAHAASQAVFHPQRVDTIDLRRLQIEQTVGAGAQAGVEGENRRAFDALMRAGAGDDCAVFRRNGAVEGGLVELVERLADGDDALRADVVSTLGGWCRCRFVVGATAQAHHTRCDCQEYRVSIFQLHR